MAAIAVRMVALISLSAVTARAYTSILTHGHLRRSAMQAASVVPRSSFMGGLRFHGRVHSNLSSRRRPMLAMSPMMAAESTDIVWRQGYYEFSGDKPVWRRGYYASRGAALTTPARGATSSSVPPTAASPAAVKTATEAAKPEAGEDCGCGEAMSLDQLKADVKAKIETVAERIKTMKGEGVKDKAVLQPHIDELLVLKGKWQAITGTPYDPPKEGAKPKAPAAAQKPEAPAATKAAAVPVGAAGKGGGGKGGGETDFVITPRAQDYSKWYQDVIAAAQMVDQSPVKGCMVIRPWGMAVWDELRDDLNRRIKGKGVQHVYLPLFICSRMLTYADVC